MPQYDVKVIKPIYTFLTTANTRKKLLVGGAGSGKSWTIAQYLLLHRFYTEHNIRILVCRKTLPSLRRSCYRLMLDLLTRYSLPYTLNKTEMVIQNGTSEIWFNSLDDLEKIKSIEGINYIWIEEATEITHKEFLQLALRARALNENENSSNEIIASFNPVDPRSFLKTMSEHPNLDTSVHHSTFRDNPFLDQAYRQELEQLASTDITYYKIYNRGEWASPGNLIYTNWDIVDHMIPDARLQSVGYGLDFGYNLPTALVKVGHKDGIVWEEELIYETHLTNHQLIERLKTLIPPFLRTRQIVADSAEPDRIEEIYNAGFNIIPCIKGPGSVKVGIDRVKRYRTHVSATSTNLIEEKQSYKWKEDKYGNVLDEPVEYCDHLMDAERYFLGQTPIQQAKLIVLGEYMTG